MPKLNRVSLTLSQDSEQVKLRIVGVGYGYAVSFEPGELEEPASFRVSVDILGDDLLKDEKLAVDVDSHVITAEEQDLGPIEMERSFNVGQSLLNEDIGEDEIKLRIVVRNDDGEVVSATTDVIKGNF